MNFQFVGTTIDDRDIIDDQMFRRRMKKREEHLRRQKPFQNTYFKICGLVELRDPLKVMPWDKIDECACCKRPVFYDSRDSEGRLHVCVACIRREVSMLEKFKPLDPEPVTPEQVGRPDMLAFQQKAEDQNKHRETDTVHTGKDYRERGALRPQPLGTPDSQTIRRK
jgi:hypothetical protein